MNGRRAEKPSRLVLPSEQEAARSGSAQKYRDGGGVTPGSNKGRVSTSELTPKASPMHTGAAGGRVSMMDGLPRNYGDPTIVRKKTSTGPFPFTFYTLDSSLEAPSNHVGNLLWAIATLLLYILDIGTDLWLLNNFYSRDLIGPTYCLIAIYGWTALTHIQMDLLNHGRIRYILIDLLQLRLVMDFVFYVQKWVGARGEVWAPPHCHFRPNRSFDSFNVGTIPSLMVQSYVIINQVEPTSYIQMACIVISSVCSDVMQ